MEGTWRGLSAWSAVTLIACALLLLAATGCGGDESSAEHAGAIATKDPARTFAPLVELAAGERYMPMSGRWFVKHSLLSIAEDRSCEDREIAVGHGRPELQNPVTDWIFLRRIGITSDEAISYYRNTLDKQCELILDETIYADQLTRPHDPGPRSAAARPAVGFYLDLEDEARGGAPTRGRTPVYAERFDEGTSQIRITYWMLFGMHAPRTGPAHEGDWERVDVLLREVESGRYVPHAVQLDVDPNEADPDARGELAWSAVERVGGTHPRVVAVAGGHGLSPASGSAVCDGCTEWRTWDKLESARAQLWYGFGGAWGEVGPTDATTGPLGPHGFWPTDEQSAEF